MRSTWICPKVWPDVMPFALLLPEFLQTLLTASDGRRMTGYSSIIG